MLEMATAIKWTLSVAYYMTSLSLLRFKAARQQKRSLEGSGLTFLVDSEC